MSIYVIDEMMGRGKTSSMINYINQSGDDVRYLFIVPLLTEVERIRKGCATKDFVEPSQFGGKLNNIKELLAEGRNIVSTHALFGMFDDEAIRLVREQGYTLVMDEITSVIRNIPITASDVSILTERFIKPGNGGKLIWTDDEYTGKLEDYKSQIDGNEVWLCDNRTLLAILPVTFFTSFKDMYLMTYLFKNQMMRCYFDLMGLTYTRLYVSGDSLDNYMISDVPQQHIDLDYSPLINIIERKSLNAIGDSRTALSKSWYIKNLNTGKVAELKNNTYNFFRNYAKTPSAQNLWSTFCKDDEFNIDFPTILGGSGYKKGFLACNSKGTNQYRNKTALAYIINVFPNTLQKTYLAKHGVSLNDGEYALSEMLQWIWRSAIRDGKPVQLYVPSLRMRTLLKDWLATKGQEVDVA